MKDRLLNSILLIFILLALVNIRCNVGNYQNETKNPEQTKGIEKSKSKLLELEEINTDYFLLSCFSLPEIRKLVFYDSLKYNNLIFPEDILQRLDTINRKRIITKMDSLYMSLSKSRKDSMYRMIEGWIEFKVYLDNLAKKKYYSLESFMEVLYNYYETRPLFKGLVDENGFGIDGLSSYQMSYIYYSAINLFAKLNDVSRANFLSYLSKESNWIF